MKPKILVSILVIVFFLFARKFEIINFSTINALLKPNKPKNEIKFCAWMPWWQEKEGWDTLENNASLFSTMSPFTYSLKEDLTITNHGETNLAEAREKFKGIEIIPTISNDLDKDRLALLLSSERLWSKHAEDIIKEVRENNLDGIDIDYELLTLEQGQNFTEFIKLLSESLHGLNKKLVITLPAKTQQQGPYSAYAYDWEQLAKYGDYLRIMAYDFHWSTSKPGPLAPISWVEQVSDYAKKSIPEGKYVLALGFYGYDWTGEGKAKNLTINQVLELAQNTKSSVKFDRESQSPNFSYNKDGVKHTVWFENEKSIKQKLDLAQKQNVNVCIWNINTIPQEYFELLTGYTSAPNSTIPK